MSARKRKRMAQLEALAKDNPRLSIPAGAKLVRAREPLVYRRPRTMRLIRAIDRRRRATERWRGQFRCYRQKPGDRVRIQGQPANSKRQRKHELLAAAQRIRPAIRTIKGAKKLEKLIERGRVLA